MAGIHAQNGRLLISFQLVHGGRRWRCREYLGLADTRDNRRLGARLATQIERELAAGVFDYAARFPASRKLTRLKLAPAAPGPMPSVAAYARQWLAAARPHLTAASYYDYGLLINRHINACELGAMELAAVTRPDVEAWVRRLQEGGVGPRRINMALARLRSMFRAAEVEGLIARNPMPLVRSLREPRAFIDPFSAAERDALLAAVPPGVERALLATLMGAGLRPSEALGLCWTDLDLERAMISVRRSRGRFGLGMTKTKASEREVDIGPSLIAELRRLQGRAARDGWVFVGPRGGPLDWTNFRTRRWPRIVAAAGVRNRPPYQCRHSYAAALLAAGANPQYVAHQMGHATLAMVVRHYARWTRKPVRGGVLEAAGL